MKATDLMIGDLVDVYCENPDESSFYRPGQIHGIHDNEICFGTGLDCPWFPLDEPDTIEPILLTPKILEKNGYTCKRSLDKEIISYNWTSPDRRVTLNDQNGSPWFCIIRSDGMMEEVMIGISYVHELQHALKLCGIEKKIVL